MTGGRKPRAYVAAPSAKERRPRAAMMIANLVRAGFDVHDWPAVMDRHGAEDAHLDEETLRLEARADLFAVRHADLVFILTHAVGKYDEGPVTSGGALIELGAALAVRSIGPGPAAIVVAGPHWPHPLFGSLADVYFLVEDEKIADALAVAWAQGWIANLREREITIDPAARS